MQEELEELELLLLNVGSPVVRKKSSNLPYRSKSIDCEDGSFYLRIPVVMASCVPVNGYCIECVVQVFEPSLSETKLNHEVRKLADAKQYISSKS